MNGRSKMFFVGLGILTILAPTLRAQEKDVESMINHAYSAMTSPKASGQDFEAALIEILDATLLILPASDYAEEFRGRIDVAKKMIVERGMLNDKVRQYLGFAYRLVTAGQFWKQPEEIRAAYRQKDILEQSQKAVQRAVDSALAERKAGRDEQSVRWLLELVLLVVTPIQT